MEMNEGTLSKQKKRGHKVNQWKLNNLLQRIDIFGANLPMFNLSGETQVLTKTGGCLSLVVLMVFLTYGVIKLQHLMDKHNPFISEVTEKNRFDYNTRLNLNEINFKMAFSVEGYLDNQVRDDPRYVKYIVRIYGKKNDVEYQELIPFHKCTKDDWDHFLDPAKGIEDQILALRKNPKRNMYCIDEFENFTIYGNEKNTEYQRVEVVLVPCNYLNTQFGYTGDSIDPECIAELD